MKDIRQTKEYADYMRETGWVVERKDSVNYFVKKLPIIGSFIKIQRPERLDLKRIDELIHEYRAFQVVVEPKSNQQINGLTGLGFKLSKSPFLPSKTIHLDLTKPKEKILKQMEKDARYSLRKSQKLKINSQRLNEIEKFRNSWKKSVGPKRHVPSLKDLIALKKAFDKKANFLTTKDGSAGAIFLVGDKTGYYWQAFTNEAGRKALSQYRLVWEGILWSKAMGAKLFDFEGIDDERFPKKEWLGFTHFKKSFGGKEIKYPGAFSKTRLPF